MWLLCNTRLGTVNIFTSQYHPSKRRFLSIPNNYGMWWGHHGGHSSVLCLPNNGAWGQNSTDVLSLFPLFLASFLKNFFCRTYLHKQCRVQPVFPFLASFHKNLRICTNCVQCHKNSKLAASLCVKLTRCFINSIYCFKSFQKDIYQRKTSANLIKKICQRQILGKS